MFHFLKPTLWKILFAAGLFYVSSLLWRSYVISKISDTFPQGFPFQYYLAWGPCLPSEICSDFNGIYLLLDVVVWYVVGAWIEDRLQPTW